jgi:hypothetical protein
MSYAPIYFSEDIIFPYAWTHSSIFCVQLFKVKDMVVVCFVDIGGNGE